MYGLLFLVFWAEQKLSSHQMSYYIGLEKTLCTNYTAGLMFDVGKNSFAKIFLIASCKVEAFFVCFSLMHLL